MTTLVAKVVAVAVGAVMISGCPASASYSIADESASPVTASSAQQTPGRGPTAAPSSPSRAGNVSASIPLVAFTADVRVTGDRLRTPVLVNASAPGGLALVLGASGTCLRRLVPGEVAWLDCPVRARGPVVVVVVLHDGTVSARAALA